MGGARGIFQLLNIASLYQCDQNTLTSYWDQFQYQIKATVFSIIESTGGHFDLTMHCSLAGASLINLIMLDDVREPGLLETNNLLGGLNTPLIGSANVVTNNAAQLCNIVQDMTNNNAAVMNQFPSTAYLPQY